ncbi:MAG TPA: hypothetical protein VKR58_04735, partial [Aquella sp.]|nr:hypothetical protein [Aquella sp.]
VDLLLAANFQVMAWGVMSTSAIAPAACGAAFVASTSRMLFALSRAKLLPAFLGKLDEKYHTPRPAILLNFFLGGSFLFMFKGWTQLVAIISVFHIFSYLSMPVVVVAYRRQLAANLTKVDSFRLPFAPFFAVIVIFILALLLFFAAWPNIGYMSVLVLPGLGFFFYYEYKNFGTKEMWKLVKNGSWLLYFMVGISLICYLGNNPAGNLINLSTSIALVAIISTSSFFYGIFSAVKSIDPK